MTQRVVALMGSYHPDGTLARSLDLVLAGARESGAEVERVDLMERHIEFCRNCRHCTQAPGETRGACVIEDDAPALLDELEAADAIVLAAPVNFGDVNARTRQLLERMVGYAYWPAGAPAPKPREGAAGRRSRKPAVLLTSSAAPALLTRLCARPLKTLRRMAKLLRARPVASLVVGLASSSEPRVGARTERRLRRAGRRLVERSA